MTLVYVRKKGQGHRFDLKKKKRNIDVQSILFYEIKLISLKYKILRNVGGFLTYKVGQSGPSNFLCVLHPLILHRFFSISKSDTPLF
jgi:hypothetical protein